MPLQYSRSDASSAFFNASMGRTASTSRSSPKTSSLTEEVNTKRSVDTQTREELPVRRSKRLKSSQSEGTKLLPLSGRSEVNGESPDLAVSKAEIEKDNTAPNCLKQESREEEEEEEEEREKEEVSTTAVKPNQKKRSVNREPVVLEDEYQQVHKEHTKKTESETTTRKKGTRKNKQEAVTMPLTARSQGLRMFVGAHVSAAKGVFNAVNNSVHVGGNAFALFLKSQRKWDNPPLQDDHKDQFHRLCRDQAYDASKFILPHGSYLVNLAQQDQAKSKQAYDSFLDDLRRCEALGISLYNFHPGSANQSPFPDAITRLANALTHALSATSTVTPVLETMCGHGTTIGGSLLDFREVLRQIPLEFHSRIGICVDTCHSFAAGYDLVSPAGFKNFMSEFDEVIGLRYLRALHLNDSRAPCGSKRDLHANIGTGFLGLRAFHNVMNESRFEGIPMILETPIDRPVEESKKNSIAEHGEELSGNGNGNNDSDDSDGTKSKGKRNRVSRSKKTPTATIPDPVVWAREIKLLESLIGMDPEGSEFKALEAQLADEGSEMREKFQGQYERKLDTEKKKKNKSKV